MRTSPTAVRTGLERNPTQCALWPQPQGKLRRSADGGANCNNSVSATAPAWCMPERRATSTASGSVRPATAPFGEDASQQGVHLPCGLRLDRLRRFFFLWREVSSTGRNPQIFSLTSTSWPQSFRKRWKAATSCCALRKATGKSNVSVRVLFRTFRVKRKWGPWPGSSRLAQWQLGLPHLPEVVVMEPRRKSPSAASWRNRALSLQLRERIRHSTSTL